MSKSEPIKHALKHYPETRDSDRKLILRVWWLQDPDYLRNFPEFFLHRALSPETIRRTRQKYQEQGKYLATKSVENKRFQKFVDTKATIVNVDGEQMVRLFE